MTQICYYGDKLSTNMAMTPEGFLICRNVPIARTGYQHYLESELVEDGDPSQVVNVYRSPNEVFSMATLASFEGKPVTDGHPDVDVTPDNYSRFSKGHVQHVRVGKGEDADKILADLYITDPDLISEIQNGKREVSAGYYAEDHEDEHGRICQMKIRGNHVAVVDEGRAGPTVSIRDSKNNKIGEKEMARKTKSSKKDFANLLRRYLRDASPEELAEAATIVSDACDEELSMDEDVDVMDEDMAMDEDVEVMDEDVDVMDEDLAMDEDVEVMDEDFTMDEESGEDLKETLSQLKDILAKLSGFIGDEDIVTDEDFEDEDVIADEDFEDEDEFVDEDIEDEDVELADEDIDVADEDIEDEDIEDEDVIVGDEDIEDEDVIVAEDGGEEAVLANDAAIKIISRAANRIRNRKDRRMVQDAIIRAQKQGRKSQMPGLMRLVKANNERRDASCKKSINVEKLQKMYDKLNPHNAK